MFKLSAIDNRLPIDVSVYGYSRYKHNDMNQSATPAIAFTAVIKNNLNMNVTTSFMFNLPLGIEPHTQRMAQKMPQPGNQQNNQSPVSLTTSNPLDCFKNCSMNTSCNSWSFNNVSKICSMFADVRLNGHEDNSFAGVKVYYVMSICTFQKMMLKLFTFLSPC